jgi:DNA-binding response OmpR family regulator
VFRVLIIEDEPDILDLIGDLLTLEGYDVRTLRRIPHGLDPIRELDPAAIVLDLRLPGLGGMELLRLLAADALLRRTPVVVCSGASDLTQVYGPELAALGCEVVRKPFELEDLIGSVRRAVWSTQSGW